MEPEGSLPHSQVPTTCPYPVPDRSSPCHVPFSLLRPYQSPGPRQVFIIRNKASFYDEELSTPRPTPKPEDHPCRLSAIAYSVHSQLPFKLEAVPPSAT